MARNVANQAKMAKKSYEKLKNSRTPKLKIKTPLNKLS
jgi:hypothetical protein